jgi:hypothetical protein
VQFADQSVIIGADLLVDLDAVALDSDPVSVSLGVLLHRCLDSRHLFWLEGKLWKRFGPLHVYASPREYILALKIART